MAESLDVRLLYFDDCPNWRVAKARLREALAGESVRESATVASMSAVISRQPVSLPASRGNPVRSRFLTAKRAAAATVVFLGAGSAAAAVGALPGGAQSTASSALAKIGISVPGTDTHSNGHADTRGKSAGRPSTVVSAGSATGGNSHADAGLCTAATATAGHPTTAVTVFPSPTTCQGQANPVNQGRTRPPANPGRDGRSTNPAGSGAASTAGSSPGSTGSGTAGSTPAAGHVPASVPAHRR